MPFIFKGDVWCDQCGQLHCDVLTQGGHAPADPSDESSYDSDDYPKRYGAEGEQADNPQHCASGNCGGVYTAGVFALSYGRFLENGLTEAGYKAVQSMLNAHGPILSEPEQEWAKFYQFAYFNNPYTSPHDWLTQTIQTHAAEVCDRYDTQRSTHAAALASIAYELATEMSSDEIQDLYQSEMDGDDYFKPTGWYSPEMD